MTRETLLAVFAHPDDESLACGGTLARLASTGVRIVLVCASRGEKGAAASDMAGADLGRLRVAEMQAAARALGVSDLIILDHPDGHLPWLRQTELAGDIRMAMSVYHPSAVLTFGDDGLYWHPDHIAIHASTTDVVSAWGQSRPTLYYVTMPIGSVRGLVNAAMARGWSAPERGFWSLPPDAFGLHATEPDLIVDVAAWVPTKLFAIRCHESQMGAVDPLSLINESDAARWLGTEHFHRAPINNRRGSGLLEQLADKKT
jgi:N-acetyl-1-D-myo-inositol-2-amino-2-deoxy-alpha-D-glucopyranoside deacetylase